VVPRLSPRAISEWYCPRRAPASGPSGPIGPGPSVVRWKIVSHEVHPETERELPPRWSRAYRTSDRTYGEGRKGTGTPHSVDESHVDCFGRGLPSLLTASFPVGSDMPAPADGLSEPVVLFEVSGLEGDSGERLLIAGLVTTDAARLEMRAAVRSVLCPSSPIQ